MITLDSWNRMKIVMSGFAHSAIFPITMRPPLLSLTVLPQSETQPQHLGPPHGLHNARTTTGRISPTTRCGSFVFTKMRLRIHRKAPRKKLHLSVQETSPRGNPIACPFLQIKPINERRKEFFEKIRGLMEKDRNQGKNDAGHNREPNPLFFGHRFFPIVNFPIWIFFLSELPRIGIRRLALSVKVPAIGRPS